MNGNNPCINIVILLDDKSGLDEGFDYHMVLL